MGAEGGGRRLSSVPEQPLKYGRVPPRADVATYRVRAELRDTSPPVWRSLELASDLNLAELHDILQIAVGWTDSHLHGFAAGPEFYSKEAERYLCPFDEAEGDTDGVPEGQVRLDEVLAEDGDTLAYAYDYGDGWQHVVTLEAVLPRGDDAPSAVCTGGERDGPPEDCGGPFSYELIAAAADPASPDPVAARAEFAQMFSEEIDPSYFETTPFDVDQINAALARVGPNPVIDVDSLPSGLADILDLVRSTHGLRTLRQLLVAAQLTSPVEVDAETAIRMVHPYAWLLDRVGTRGIRLTSAGYLPPVHVAAAYAELGLAEEWYGQGNREVDTRPVLRLRETAQKLGLLRKSRGDLLLTARGRAVCDDPVALWWHLAERLPIKAADDLASQAGLLFLLVISAGRGDDVEQTVASLIDSMGWMQSDGGPVEPWLIVRAAEDTVDVLRRLGAMTGQLFSSLPRTPTADGTLFGRAALTTWPK
jgi:hypothetical protein